MYQKICLYNCILQATTKVYYVLGARDVVKKCCIVTDYVCSDIKFTVRHFVDANLPSKTCS